MKDRDPTLLLSAGPWHDPRIDPLQDAWLLTIAAILPAIAVPWFVSGLRIDLAAAAAGVLALGAIRVGFALLAARTHGRPHRHAGSLAGLHALGVIAVGFTWQHAGGIQNPLFLLVFALPVIGAVFVSRWQPYLAAGVAAVLVALVAAAQAPELRWYAPLLGAAADWLGRIFGTAAGVGAVPFAGFQAPAAYFLVVLQVFVIMLFACAVAAEYLGTMFQNMGAHLMFARAEAARAQELWTTLLEELPVPAVLLDADTHEVVCASGALTRYFSLTAPIAGRDLFQAVRFSYPEPVQGLIHGAGGVERLCMIRVGQEFFASEVWVQHLAQHGRRLALLLFHDVTVAFCVKAALDATEHAALVVDARGHVLAFNRPAQGLFAGAAVGAELARLVPQAEHGQRWWDPGLSGRRKLHLTVMRRVYQVTCSAVPLPGESARLFVVTLLPAAQLVPADQVAAGIHLTRRS
jgi:hypothetical protein